MAFRACIQYKREEQAKTVSLWYAMNGTYPLPSSYHPRPGQLTFLPFRSAGVQLALGGMISYGFYHVQGLALKNWQMMYLVLGLLTVVWGLFVGVSAASPLTCHRVRSNADQVFRFSQFWLPDSPMKAGRFFSQEDRTKMIERVRENGTG